jgi:hypothetical protein
MLTPSSGFKPVSAFGLAHKFSTAKIRDTLRRQLNYRDGYPISENAPAALAFMDRFLIDFSILESERATELEVLPLVHRERPSIESQSDSVAGIGGEALPLTALEGKHTPDADTRSQLLSADEAGVGEEALPLVAPRALYENSGLDSRSRSVVGAEAVSSS